MSTSTGPARLLRALLIIVAVLAASLTAGGLVSSASATGTGTLTGQVSLPSFWKNYRPTDTRVVITLYRWNGSLFEVADVRAPYQPNSTELASNTFTFSQAVSGGVNDYYALSFSSPTSVYALPTTWLGGTAAPTTPGNVGSYQVPTGTTRTVGTTIQDVLYGNGTVRDARGQGFSAQVTSYYWFNNTWTAYVTTTAATNGAFSVPLRPGHSMAFAVVFNGSTVAYSGGGSSLPAGPGAGDGSDGTYYYDTSGNVAVRDLYASGVNANPGGGGTSNGGTNGNGTGTGNGSGTNNGSGTCNCTNGGTTTGGTVHPAVKAKSFIAYRLTNAGLHPGQKAKFKVRVSGPAGIPTGIVTLKTVSGKLLGVANVRHDGTAVLRSYSLPHGYYYVKIRYKGSDTYLGAKTKKIYFCVD